MSFTSIVSLIYLLASVVIIQADPYCSAGTYFDTTTEECEPCATGTYSLDGQRNSCLLCPEGHECPSTSLPPVRCGRGYYSPAGSISCSVCQGGYLCESGSSSASPAGSECPFGGYCSSLTPGVFTPCPEGTFGARAAASSEVEGCDPCPAGHYCPRASTLHTIRTCPAGHYCPLGSGTPTACPAGSFVSEVGQSSLAECLPCPSGAFCPSGASTPQVCSAGHFCPASSGAPLPCAAGTYSGHKWGLQQQEDCSECPAGRWCAGLGAPAAELCVAGTFQPDGGSALCLPCPAGQHCPVAGLSSLEALSPCWVGHYCPTGSVTPTPCPAGSLTDWTNITRATECDICPPSHYCPVATGGRNAPPRACAQGHYCPAGTAFGTQFPCPAGSYTARTNLHSAEQCTPCPKGHYCPAGSVTPTMCSAGSYADVAGRASCLICPAGQYCPQKTIQVCS